VHINVKILYVCIIFFHTSHKKGEKNYFPGIFFMPVALLDKERPIRTIFIILYATMKIGVVS
jgi:hypothetical protein